VGVILRSMALATRRWKLEYYLEDGAGRLFDRINDPQEQVDLFGDETCRAVRDRLLTGLLAWYGDTTDLHGLMARSHRGGPIARRAVSHVKQLTGTESEERLNRICREVDALP
jgi:hypothetical protein